MEQDCITGVYQSLGLSIGEKFSTEDVSHLYCKVFHAPSDIEEAHMAMMKIAGSDNSWSCVGENVLDVLLEMAREREKKEKQYWDLQLLNMGNHLSILHRTDTPLISDPHVLHQKDVELNIFRIAHSQTGSLQSSTKSSQWERRMAKKDMQWSVRDAKRLKKAHRQCWARLVVEGIQSILPSPLHPEVGGHTWGAVSLSDVLLLVEVKYDVVTHLLYTEMLQEHYTLSAWENLLPWQQRKAEEGLGDLAEEALESGDVLGLAELPGAFKIYRFQEQSWSAISFLCELNTLRRREKDMLAALGERLNRESLRLLCLYIRLATLKAQREKLSYSALLAARQSWETWPYVNSPLRAEQAALWLQHEDKVHKGLISVLPKQTVLQLLVLTQEQERKNLVKLVHGVSQGNLQDPGYTEAPKEETSQKDAALRNGCIKRLQQIHGSLKTNNDTQNPPLEDCAQLLLIHLMELQDVQTSVLLPALMDKSTQHIEALRDECESELRGQHQTNLFQLLTSDAPLGSFSTQMPNSNTTQNSNNDQMAAQASCTREARAQNISATDTEAADSVGGAGVQADVQDVCTGYGAFVEDLPYLEILCVSDATSNTQREGGAEGVEEVGATTNPQSYEKQGSLIALAWSKPLDDDNDCGAEGAAGSTTPSQCDEGDRKSEVQPGDLSDAAEHTHGEETLVQLGLAGDTRSASQQCSSDDQLMLNERAVTEPSATGKYASDCEVQVLASVVENLQDTQPVSLMGSEDSCSGTSSETGDVNTMAGDSEVSDLSGPELTQADCSDTTFYSSSSEREVMRESTMTERERAREPVSAMERERTMRCLVDKQKKVEQRQQRDKQRQLLRVQERLSIIQNRKAEEDLLGLKHTDRLKHLTQDLPQEDKNQQKTVVKERLDQLRRERSYIMQSKRDRNTAGFKELLGPVAQQSRETEDDTD